MSRVAKKEYAVYKGEQFIGIGTAPKLAEQLGVKPIDIYIMHNRYKNPRTPLETTQEYIAIILEDDE